MELTACRPTVVQFQPVLYVSLQAKGRPLLLRSLRRRRWPSGCRGQRVPCLPYSTPVSPRPDRYTSLRSTLKLRSLQHSPVLRVRDKASSPSPWSSKSSLEDGNRSRY